MDAANRLHRRLLAALLLTIVVTSGCGWVRQLTADWPTLQRLPDRDFRQPSTNGALGSCPDTRQQGADDLKAIAEERSRNEAAYLSRNPAAKAP